MQPTAGHWMILNVISSIGISVLIHVPYVHVQDFP